MVFWDDVGSHVYYEAKTAFSSFVKLRDFKTVR